MRELGTVLGMAALTVVVAGCGGTQAVATVASHTDAVTTATQDSAQTVVSSPHLLRARAPLPAPRPGFFVAMSPAANAMRLSIIDMTGRVLASTVIPQADEWLTAAGPGGAYWLDSGRAHVLAIDGSVRTLGAVPANASGLLVSPDGTEFAYSVAQGPDASGVMDNRIVVQPLGGAARVIVDRHADSSHTSSDTPAAWWTYMLLSWTDQGILFIRDAYGGCGCGPFDMEMQAGYTALIDPVTGGTSDLTNDSTCPLSGLGPYQTAACFHHGNSVDQLRLLRQGKVATAIAMSGTDAAGGALFSPDGGRLAYVTERETSTAGCGGTWLPTLHVLALDGSGANAVTIDNFSTWRWNASGLYGAISGPDSWSLVKVDTSSLAVHTIWTGASSSFIIGLV